MPCVTKQIPGPQAQTGGKQQTGQPQPSGQPSIAGLSNEQLIALGGAGLLGVIIISQGRKG